MVVFHAHMKGLFALQYPLLLSACAIEHNHVPSKTTLNLCQQYQAIRDSDDDAGET